MSLKEQPVSWVNKFDISHSAVHELLQILSRYHDSLPKDPRTLLNTKREYAIFDLAGGSYHHFGLKNCLTNIIDSSALYAHADTILLQINIDGLPLCKSSNIQFWPILGKIIAPAVSNPFIVGLFCGKGKPTNVNAYLQSFVSELNGIETDHLHIEIFQKRIKVLVSCIICDTPARAFVKKVKGHIGYYGCDKCSQRGMWIDNRMTFPEINSPLRTDVAFDEMSDELHHTGLSPFRGLQIGLVSQFPLDYMHLICLGVVKRLLLLWIKGPLENSCRLSARTVGEISQKLIQMSRHVPREFLRKGRS